MNTKRNILAEHGMRKRSFRHGRRSFASAGRAQALLAHSKVGLIALLALAGVAHAADEYAVSEKERAKIEAQMAGTYNPLSFYDGKLVLDAQERVRFESRKNNIRFNDDLDNDTDEWLLNRIRVGLKLAPSSKVAFYGQLQDAREFDSTRVSPIGDSNIEESLLDVRQASVEVADYKSHPLGVKIGRQELSYGDERLVGAFDWNNIGRVFDAAKVRWQEKKFSVDAFFANVVLNNAFSRKEDTFDDEADTADDFYGLYGQCLAPRSQLVEAYALYREKEDAEFDGPAREIWTFGSRVKSKPVTAPFDYNAEAVFQTGEITNPGAAANRRFGDNATNDVVDHLAYALVVGGGYTLADTPWQPRFGAEYNYASGDEDPADGENGTLDNLYPTNHKFFGYMDEFAWKNMHNPLVSLTVQPSPKLKTSLFYRWYWLAEDRDFWYRATQAPNAPGRRNAAGGADSYVGSEIDLALWWNITKKFAVHGGYSHFFAGDFVSDTAGAPDALNGDDDADFAYVQMAVTY